MSNLFQRLNHKLRNEKGMTLAETLMAVLIMSIIFTAVGGGVVVMRNNYEKVTLKARAQVLITTAISLMNTDLDSATSVTKKGTNLCCFYSSRRNLMMTFKDDTQNPNRGICLVCTDSDGSEIEGTQVVLVPQKKMTDSLYTCLVSKESPTTPGSITYHDGYFEYTICVKKLSDDKVMETMNVMVSPISPIKENITP